MGTLIGILLVILFFTFIFFAPIVAFIFIKYRFFSFLGKSYFFWAALSLYNFDLLGVFALPQALIFIRSPPYDKFYGFLHLPLTYALVASTVITVCIVCIFSWLRNSPLGKAILPFLFNIILLVAFLLCAESHKNWLIAKAIKDHDYKPDCIVIHSFLESLSHGGQEYQLEEHALFTEGGKTFFWSYSQLDFFEVGPSLTANFHCRPPNGSQ